MSDLASRFDAAYRWLCKRRAHHLPNSDVWDFRRGWSQEQFEVIESFRRGEYRFSPQESIMLADDEVADIWSSRDSVVLKVVTEILLDRLRPVLSKRCYHVRGHGGAKAAVRHITHDLPDHVFFCKTDVRGYYEHIDHHHLMMQVHALVGDKPLTGYVWQYLNRCVEWGGLFRDEHHGIARGCSLSPLVGAVHLLELDREMERHGVVYYRYMDDILILAPARWRLKRAVKAMNFILGRLGLDKHRQKTDMGRIEKGFDFLGYRFAPDRLGIADKTIVNFFGKALRLYEQEPPREKTGRLGMYIKRWLWWCGRGLVVKPDTRETLAEALTVFKSLCSSVPAYRLS